MNENPLENDGIPAQEQDVLKKEPAAERPFEAVSETLAQIKEIDSHEDASEGEDFGMAKIGERVDADSSEIKAAGEAVRFWERSEEFREKRETAREVFEGKVCKALLPIATAFAMQWGTALAEVNPEQITAMPETPVATAKAETKETHPPEIFDTGSPLAQSSEMKRKSDRPMTEEEIGTLQVLQTKSWEGKNEWVSLSGYKDGKYVVQIKESGSTGGYTELEIGDEMKSEALTHTHPVEASGNAKMIREGKSKAFIMPPSSADIGQCMTDASSDTLQRVVDPRGVWEYQCDENHPFVQAQRKLRENFAQAFETIRMRYKVDDNDLEKAVISSQSSHPIEILTKVFGLLESKYPGISESSQDSFAGVMRTNVAFGASLLEYESEGMDLLSVSQAGSDEESAKKIAAFIQNAEKRGVYMSYTPFKEAPHSSGEK